MLNLWKNQPPIEEKKQEANPEHLEKAVSPEVPEEAPDEAKAAETVSVTTDVRYLQCPAKLLVTFAINHLL